MTAFLRATAPWSLTTTHVIKSGRDDPDVWYVLRIAGGSGRAIEVSLACLIGGWSAGHIPMREAALMSYDTDDRNERSSDEGSGGGYGGFGGGSGDSSSSGGGYSGCGGC